MKKVVISIILVLVLVGSVGIISVGDERVEVNVPLQKKSLYCITNNKVITIPRILLDEREENLLDNTLDFFVWDRQKSDTYVFGGKCAIVIQGRYIQKWE